MGLFKDKNVIITGAAGGIGKGISKAFAKEGAKIALIDFDEKNLKETLKEDKIPPYDHQLSTAVNVIKGIRAYKKQEIND